MATDARRRGAGVRGRGSGVDIRVGGNGGNIGQRVDNRVGGNGGSEHRGDESQTGGSRGSEDQQVETPVDRNEDSGDLGRVHGRDDRTETLPDRSKRRRSP